MIGLRTGMIVPQRFQIIGQRIGDGDLGRVAIAEIRPVLVG
jgi:hypothetical protein